MSFSQEILQALFRSTLRQKQIAVDGLRRLCEQRVHRAPPWWQWTVWLAHGITAKRIEDA